MADGKVAAVVGIGPGLGAAVARRFSREGYAVALMARSRDKLDRIAGEIESAGGEALPVACDATDPESVAKAFATLRDGLDDPEVLVYNAGAFRPGGILELDAETFEDCWKANCFGAFLAAHAVLPKMAERGRGTIIFTGATAAMRGGARFAALAVGKFGLRALAQSMAREFGPRGVHVAHVIVDGQILAPAAADKYPDREPEFFLSPDSIARSYWELHRQDPTAWTLELDLRPAVEKF